MCFFRQDPLLTHTLQEQDPLLTHTLQEIENLLQQSQKVVN